MSCEARTRRPRRLGARAAGGGWGCGTWASVAGSRGRGDRHRPEARGWRPEESLRPDVAGARRPGPLEAARRGAWASARLRDFPASWLPAGVVAGGRSFAAVTLDAVQAGPATGGRVRSRLLPPGVTLDLGPRASVSSGARPGRGSVLQELQPREPSVASSRGFLRESRCRAVSVKSPGLEAAAAFIFCFHS